MSGDRRKSPRNTADRRTESRKETPVWLYFVATVFTATLFYALWRTILT